MVQRPSSVVKELVENSVDAGAQNIYVIIKDSGRTLIQVIDDGCGFSPEDAKTAFLRHATSKITTAEDLNSILTFGFRGEGPCIYLLGGRGDPSGQNAKRMKPDTK